MIFGISRQQIQRVTILGACLGFLLLAVFFAVGVSHGTIRSAGDITTAVAYAVAIGSVLPVVVGASGFIKLRVENDDVFQMVGRWSVSKRPLQELSCVSFAGSLFPVSLRFRDGTRFRLLALHLRDRQRLAAYLQTRVPRLEFE
jgi:hypothetical protein